MPDARLAKTSDLASLLALFRASEVSHHAEPAARAERIWSDILARDGIAVFVADADSGIASSCMLVMVPNLLRGGRQHGFLENVVTHPQFRGRGYGQAVVHAALALAWASDCHHVLLQSGRNDPRVHRFYAQCGFEAGLRVGYAVHRPAAPSGERA